MKNNQVQSWQYKDVLPVTACVKKIIFFDTTENDGH